MAVLQRLVLTSPVLAFSLAVDSEGTAKAAARTSGKASALLTAARRMLTNGGKNTDVVSDFAKDTFETIQSEVEPAILRGHEEDQKILESIWAEYGIIQQDLAERTGEIQRNEKKEEADAGKVHTVCRNAQLALCEERQACEAVLAEKWENVTMHEEMMATVHEEIEVKYCDPESNTSAQAFRDYSVDRFTRYIKKKKETDEAKRIYHEQVPICDAAREVEDTKRDQCENLQQLLEESSCGHAREIIYVSRAVEKGWAQIAGDYTNASHYVEENEEDRKMEFITLQEVKCLLENIHETIASGEPCDEAAHPEQTQSQIKRCHDLATDTSAFDMVYKETPPVPELPAVPAYPGTTAFFDREYAYWSTCDCVNAEQIQTCQPDQYTADV